MTPRLFISSTIRDFEDLRGAAKYWLSTLGFHVQLSEFSDFDKPVDENTLEACLAAVRTCDAFIVLIGERRGSWADSDRSTSITQAEYLAAAAKPGLPIVRLIRRRAWDAYSRSKSDGVDPGGFEDWDHFKRLMREVEGGSPGNWIHPFSTFEDIANVLKVGLNLAADVEEQALLEMACGEIEESLRFMIIRRADDSCHFCTEAVARFTQLVDVKAIAKGLNVGDDQKVNLGPDARRCLQDASLMLWGEVLPPTPTLERLVHSSSLMEFDGQSKSLRSSPLKTSLANALRKLGAVTHQTFARNLNDLRTQLLAELYGNRDAEVWPVSASLLLGIVAMSEPVDEAVAAASSAVRLVRFGDSRPDAPALRSGVRSKIAVPIEMVRVLCRERGARLQRHHLRKESAGP